MTAEVSGADVGVQLPKRPDFKDSNRRGEAMSQIEQEE